MQAVADRCWRAAKAWELRNYYHGEVAKRLIDEITPITPIAEQP